MRLLIAGWQGQVARALVELVPGRDDVTSFAVGRPALDLYELPTLQRAMSDANPDVIISAAGYTGVDKAERERDEAFALNRDGPRLMAEAAATKGIPILHLSTDYVFDGQLDRAYREDDATAPQTVFGQSKLEGEQAVRAANARHIILRTSWVYSSAGNSIVSRLLQKAQAGDRIDVVADQIGTPTYAPHLAKVILDVAARVCGRGADDADWGVYHAAGSGEASWFTYAQRIMQVSGQLGGPALDVHAIASRDYPTDAPRLANARLNCCKLSRVFGLQLPDWHDGVAACVEHLHKSNAGGV